MCLDPQQSLVYQLRIVLVGISPLIWRRLRLSGSTHLARLHDILQILFSWSGERSSRFRIHSKTQGNGPDNFGPLHSGAVFEAKMQVNDFIAIY
jgi:hypothetical protein